MCCRQHWPARFSCRCSPLRFRHGTCRSRSRLPLVRSRAASLHSRLAGAVVLVWLVGVVFGLAGLATGIFRLRRLVSGGIRITEGLWSEEAEIIRRKYKLSTPVRLI